MRSLGIDLAAEPKGTAIAVIEWSREGAHLLAVQANVTDDEIVLHASRAQKVGIDCALGWPADFISFLVKQQGLETFDGEFDGGIEWRRQLAFRATDRHVRAKIGRWPLSVATDRLGMTAIRCSGLLTKLKSAGLDIDRTGAGDIVEVYPAASLKIWGFESFGYRNSRTTREKLLDDLFQKAPWLDLGEFHPQLVDSCDAFDSLFAALSARSAALGFYDKPVGHQIELAKTEGWIALPAREFQSLLIQ